MHNEHELKLSAEQYSWLGNDGGYKIGKKVIDPEKGEPLQGWHRGAYVFQMFEPMGTRLTFVDEKAISEYLGDANNPRRKPVERDLTATEKADINTLVENALGPTIDAAMGGN